MLRSSAASAEDARAAPKKDSQTLFILISIFILIIVFFAFIERLGKERERETATSYCKR
jgi:hypothetical protein